MLIEGKGPVAPKPWTLRLRPSDVLLLRPLADRISKHRRYAQRPDRWGRGYLDDPMFVGLCGEHALCVYLNRRLGLRLSVGRELLPGGDGGVDQVVFGMTIQVKTRVARKNRFKRFDDHGIRPIKSELLVFCKLLPLEGGFFSVQLLGWTTALAFGEKATLVRSPRDSHHNLEIAEQHLEGMPRLLELLSVRRAA